MKVVAFITDYAAADDRVKAFFDKYLRGKNVRISTATIENWKH
jgi:hypothetical protein